MRTRERDTSGLTTFGAYTAGTGSGVAQPGNVPFTVTPGATGNYTVNLDPRLVPLSISAQSGTFTRLATAGVAGPGALTCVRVIANTGAGENGGFYFVCTARDMRT